MACALQTEALTCAGINMAWGRGSPQELGALGRKSSLQSQGSATQPPGATASEPDPSPAQAWPSASPGKELPLQPPARPRLPVATPAPVVGGRSPRSSQVHCREARLGTPAPLSGDQQRLGCAKAGPCLALGSKGEQPWMKPLPTVRSWSQPCHQVKKGQGLVSPHLEALGTFRNRLGGDTSSSILGAPPTSTYRW